MAIGLGDVVRLSAVIHDARNSEVINTWDVEVTGAGSGGNTGFKEDCREWLEGLYDPISGLIHDGASTHHISFFHRNGTEALTPIGWSAPDFTAGFDELPDGISAILFARTGTRRVVSKKFIGPCTEANSTLGAPDSVATGVLLDMGDFWKDPFTGANGWELQAGVWPRTNTGIVAIAETGVSEHWGIQRRRRRGRGS